MKGRTISLFLSLFLLLAISLSQAIPHEIRVTLELDNLQLDQQIQNELQARIKFENKGEHIAFPEIAIPSEESKNSLFSVISTSTGKSAKYIGKSAQYLLSKVPLVYLPSLHSLSSSINLLNFYHFEEDGEYEVKLNVNAPLIEGGNIQFTSNGVVVKVSGASPYIHQSRLISKRTVLYTGCSSSQQMTLGIATAEQTTSVLGSLAYLNAGCTNNGYIDFFNDLTYYSDVEDTFQNVADVLSYSNGFTDYTFDCAPTSCTQFEIAFVTPADTTHKISICPEFWNQADGVYVFNSKQGALTNQMVRFNDVAYAPGEMYDYQFTVQNCLTLAEQDPIDARRNPYNYQYFQEVVPYCGEMNLQDCYEIGNPTDYYVDDCSNVCNNLVGFPVPFFCSAAPRKDPANDVIAETTAGTNPNYWSYVADVKANTFANITQLQPGSTYYFTTCRLSDDGNYYDSDPLLPFATAIVIRDPSNNILEYNFGCFSCDADDLNGALVEYFHPTSAQYSNILVNVYSNPYPQQSTTPTSCNRESSLTVPLYQRVDTSITCNVYLQPKSTYTAVLSATGTASITSSDVSNSASSSFCYKANTFTTTPNSFTCDDVGVVPVTVTQSSGPSVQSIHTTVNVVDNSLPTITCIANQYLDGRSVTYGEFCVANIPYSSNVNCYIHNTQLNLNTFIDVDDNCGVSVKTYDILSTDPTNAVMAGDTLQVKYSVLDYSSNSQSQTCNFNIYGLFISSVPSQSTFYAKPKPSSDIFFTVFADSTTLSTSTAYLYLSSVSNKGLPYDFDNHRFIPLTLANIIANALSGQSTTTGKSAYAFNNVDFPSKSSKSDPESYKLTVALATSTTAFVLSYADPIIYLLS